MNKQELIEELLKRATACEKLKEKVPTDNDEMHVRSHVRLHAKEQTYRHAAKIAELLENQ
jgi:hypothetical protein